MNTRLSLQRNVYGLCCESSSSSVPFIPFRITNRSNYKQFVYDDANKKASYEFYKLFYQLGDRYCKIHYCNIIK